ncbi:hypothetical protein ABTP85_19600, partial [Acinetobacter baumannii]
SSDRYFDPKGKVNKAQYAVVLKRLYDFFDLYKRDHFAGSPSQKTQIANLLLTTASYSYQKQDQTGLKQYFEPAALDALKEIYPSPLHTYDGE